MVRLVSAPVVFALSTAPLAPLPVAAQAPELLADAPVASAGTAPRAADETSSDERHEAAYRAMLEGQVAYREERYDDAVQSFRAAQQDAPDWSAAAYNESCALRRGKRYNEARDVLERLVDAQPTDLDALFALARVANDLGDTIEAEVLLEAYLGRETREDRRSLWEEASRLLTGAPQTTSPACGLAFTGESHTAAHRRFCEAARLYTDGAHREAAGALLSLQRADPANLDVLYRRGLALREAGEHVAALASFRSYLSARPDDMDGLYAVAELELVAGETEAARASLQRYVSAESRADAAPWIARATRLLSRLAAAPSSSASFSPGDGGEPTADPAQETAPASEPPRFARALRARAQRVAARQLLEEGRAADALSAYERLLAADPESEPVRLGLVDAEAALRAPDGSAPPESFAQLLAAGEAALIGTDGAAAKDAYGKALALAEGSARVHLGLAKAYVLLGEVAQALVHYRRHRELLELPTASEVHDDAFWRVDRF